MKKVLIIFGGNSSEHYVSCKSAKSIIENIDSKLFNYETVGITKDGRWFNFNDDLKFLEDGNWLDASIKKIDNVVDYIKQFDVVFPIIHGSNGEDGKLQGFLELFNIKFVGCKTLASAIGMDKEMSKVFFEHLGIKQVPYLVLEENYSIEEINKVLKFPLIVKPANGGSSIGISKANNKDDLINALEEAKKYDKKIILEKFIECRELECAVLEKNGELICSVPGEIKSANQFYDYDAKYVNKKSYTVIPNDLPKNIVQKIQDYAKKIFKSLNCHGYSRIDFFYDDEDIYINEINTIPGFTNISMYPILMKNENISYKELITILINNA